MAESDYNLLLMLISLQGR